MKPWMTFYPEPREYLAHSAVDGPRAARAKLIPMLQSAIDAGDHWTAKEMSDAIGLFDETIERLERRERLIESN